MATVTSHLPLHLPNLEEGQFTGEVYSDNERERLRAAVKRLCEQKQGPLRDLAFIAKSADERLAQVLQSGPKILDRYRQSYAATRKNLLGSMVSRAYHATGSSLNVRAGSGAPGPTQRPQSHTLEAPAAREREPSRRAEGTGLSAATLDHPLQFQTHVVPSLSVSGIRTEAQYNDMLMTESSRFAVTYLMLDYGVVVDPFTRNPAYEFLISAADNNAGEILMCDMSSVVGKSLQQSLVSDPATVRHIMQGLHRLVGPNPPSSLYFPRVAIAPPSKTQAVDDAWVGELIIRQAGNGPHCSSFSVLCITLFREKLIENNELRDALTDIVCG